MKPRLLLAAIAVQLAACGGLTSRAEPDRIYVLHAAADTAAPAVGGVLSVLRPAVQPGLDTDRIALTRAGNELDYYAASRWGGSLPRVIAALAVESLAGGGFATVVDGTSGSVRSDFELLLTARHFEADHAGGLPVARVSFECVLTSGSPRRVLGRCDAEVTEPARANRMGEIVAALERAAQRALAEVRSRAVAAARSQ